MIEGAINNVSTNKQNPYLSMDVFSRVPVYLQTGMRGSKMQTDNVELTSKQPMSKSKKALLSIGGIAMVALGTVYGVKKLQVKNIKNIQKAFQECFMRDDITIEETRAIIKRYKEIEKIKDDKEYAKALFEEAKKNFGLEKSDIKLVFKEKKGAAGYCTRGNDEISITSNCSRSHMLNTMHHEFRHAKQHNILYNSYPEDYYNARVLFESYVEKIINEKGKNIKLEDIKTEELWLKAFKEVKEKGYDLTGKKAEELVDLYKNEYEKYFVKETVPDKYKEWIEKCREGVHNYADIEDDFVKYWNNFTEIDARNAGRKMDKYVKSKAFTITDWLEDSWMKYRTRNANKKSA